MEKRGWGIPTKVEVDAGRSEVAEPVRVVRGREGVFDCRSSTRRVMTWDQAWSKSDEARTLIFTSFLVVM